MQELEGDVGTRRRVGGPAVADHAEGGKRGEGFETVVREANSHTRVSITQPQVFGKEQEPANVHIASVKIDPFSVYWPSILNNGRGQ
jgi:hypothetical protein